jgi:hypothetical protein
LALCRAFWLHGKALFCRSERSIKLYIACN